jgi:hypothetical protein
MGPPVITGRSCRATVADLEGSRAAPVGIATARVPTDRLRAARCITEDQPVERVDVPLLGGPLDGRDIDVEVDDDGLPPEHLTESSLWFAHGSELLDTDLAGRYVREPVAGSGPPWLYVWIPRHRPAQR